MNIAVNTLPPGAVPDDSGWYVVEDSEGRRSCVFLTPFYGNLYVVEAGREGGVPVGEFGGRFLARLEMDAPMLVG